MVSNVRSINFNCHVDDLFAELKVGYIPYNSSEVKVEAKDLVANIEATLDKKEVNNDEAINTTIQGPDKKTDT